MIMGIYIRCAYEVFPEEFLAQIPEEKRGKVCSCINCLNQYKKKHSGWGT